MDAISECSASSPEYDFYPEELGSDDEFRPHTLPRAAKPGSSAAGRIAKKGRPRSRSLKEHKRASPAILDWLDQNYHTQPGSCLPRSVLYTHYQDFCKRNHVEPSSAATFGKVIRLKFPNLSTRRLGTRGQSKYHYYGLAIRETSPYFRSSYSQKGLTRFSSSSSRREAAILSPSTKPNIQLPEFPHLKNISFSQHFPIQKLETFLLMYRAHCQRILDSVVRSNFDEVQEFLVHFWQGMPSHVLPILSCQVTLDLIVVCDFILYKTLSEALVPSSLHGLPDSAVSDMQSFTKDLVDGLFQAVVDLPATLGIIKVQTAELFGKSLRRQLALVQLAKAARSVLASSEFITCVLNDLRKIDFPSIAQRVVSLQAHSGRLDAGKLLEEFATELEQLLVKQSTIEVYFEWLDSIAEREMHKGSEHGGSKLEVCQELLSLWGFFTTCLEGDLVSTGGRCQEMFRSLQMLLNEYMCYVTEMVQTEMIELQYYQMMRGHANPSLAASSDTGAARPLPSTMFSPPSQPTPSSTTTNQLSLSIKPHRPQEHDFLQKFESAITTEYQEVSVKKEPGTPYQAPETYPNLFDITTPSPQSGSCANSPSLSNKTLDTFFKIPAHNVHPFHHFSQASVFSGFDLDSGIDFTEDLGTFSGSLSSTSSTMDLQLPEMPQNSYDLLELEKFLNDPFASSAGPIDGDIPISMLSDPLH